MFLRKVTVTENRKRQVYLEILEHEPKRGKGGRPIARLGPLGGLSGKLGRLVRSLGELCGERFVSASEISAEQMWSWGPVLAARHLWEDFGLTKIISGACGRAVAEGAFALTANRLIEPYWEHGISNWLNKVCIGEDLFPEGRVSHRGKRSTSLAAASDDYWDTALGKLAAKRRSIESALFSPARGGVREICGGFDEVVLYQLDASFAETVPPRAAGPFMGWPAPEARRSTKLHFAAIVCGGWPLTLRFFGGSEPTVGQIKRFVDESQSRLGFRKILFVAPSGTEEEKLQQLRSIGLHYLVGVRRRQDPRAVELIQQTGRHWVKIGGEIKVQEALLPAETDDSLRAVPPEDVHSERYFLVHSRAEEREERNLRISLVARALRALGELKSAVEEGRLKKPATIMARAERILAQRKGYRYVSWRISPDGCFEFWKDERKSAIQRAYEGISLLKTSDTEISPSYAVSVYEGLRRVQDAFNKIHDTANFRSSPLPLPELEESPANAHARPPSWAPSRAARPAAARCRGSLFAGHLLVSHLAFLLQCRLERRLMEKKIAMPFDSAMGVLETISLAQLRIGEEKRLVVSPGNRAARRIVRALGIEKLQPTEDAGRGWGRRGGVGDRGPGIRGQGVGRTAGKMPALQ